MAGISVHDFVVSASGGSLVLELRASGQLPIQGVLTTLGQQAVPARPRFDPALIAWELPLREERYLVWGVITPTQRILFAPAYTRNLTQGGTILRGSVANPQKRATRKVNTAEWVGSPEVLRIRVKMQ